MFRIRLHGRGGQGIKTASQILGSSAFFSGFQAQDFPLYGAERRGAPIVAFTRIDSQNILERGPILIPDILLIGDESLLEDVQAAPLCGADSFTTIFINSSKTPKELQKKYQLSTLPLASDLTNLCVQFLNNGSFTSAALAAVGVRALGQIDLTFLNEAVELELSAQGIGSNLLKKNIELAQEVFHTLKPVDFKERTEKKITPSSLTKTEQKPVFLAAPIILEPGNMALRKTGNWRLERPEIDYKHCNNCLICYARCPDGVIGIRKDGSPEIDYDHCKGCLICAQECPGHFIKTVKEAGSWE
jgi:pyruvate ferredoxin oxidoreductase gamma subunit